MRSPNPAAVVNLVLICVCSVAAATLVACKEEGPAEKAGKAVDDAGRKAADAVEDAGDKIEDATDKIKDKANGK